jgi:hypothetical protein
MFKRLNSKLNACCCSMLAKLRFAKCAIAVELVHLIANVARVARAVVK